MEEVALLSSGGKDSSLAAFILKKLGYEVKLVNVNFGILDSWKVVREVAEKLNCKFSVLRLKRKIFDEACDIILEDGYPNNGIKFIHLRALEELARRNDKIGDGTRRDDKVPMLSFGEMRSIEDRFNVEYIAPLRGFGYKTVRDLSTRIFIIEEGEDITKGDYEAELREELPLTLFPKHKQSRVVGVKEHV